MNVLLFSSFLITAILLIRYFTSDTKNGVKLLTVFGIGIGCSAIGINYIIDDSFGASTPVNIEVKNLTSEKIKLYSIAFWENNWNGSGNYVTAGPKLQPNQTNDFWFENDGTAEFWIVAKNINDEIIFLTIYKEKESRFKINIARSQDINQDKLQLANELIFKTDKKNEMKNFSFWITIILTGLLLFSLIKFKSATN